MSRARRTLNRNRGIWFFTQSSRAAREHSLDAWRIEPLEPRRLLAAGALDPTFGTDGELAVQFPGGQTVTVVRDSVVQPDGKIVVVGQALEQSAATATDFVIARLNPDGSPDLTFNGSGIFLFPSPGNGDDGTGVALQSDGRIVVSAAFVETREDMVNYSLFAVGRFNTDGSVDVGFGDEGASVINFTVTDSELQQGSATDVLVSADDKITLIGYAAPDPTVAAFAVALARLNADGTPDAGFGVNGQVLASVSGQSELGFSGAFDAAGNIVVAGLGADVSTSATLTHFLTTRFLPTGALDTTFGEGGSVTAEFVDPADGAALAAADAVAVQADGKIVVGGFAAHADAAGNITGVNIALVRYNPDGTPDRRFGTRGQVETDLGPLTSVNKLLLDPDGRIIASGLSAPTPDAVNALQFDPFVAQYTPAGRLDTTFGSGGSVTIDVGPPTLTAAPSLPLTLHAAAARLVASPQAEGDPTQSEQAVAALRKQSAIVVALRDSLLVVTTSSDQLTAARLIGNGADLVAGAVTGIKAASVVGGSKGAIAVKVTDAGNEPLAATVTLRVLLSTDAVADDADATAATTTAKVGVKAGRGKTLKVKFDFPSNRPDGAYFVLAVIDAGDLDINDGNNTGATPAAVIVAQPFVDLGGTVATPPALKVGKGAKLTLNLQNPGNILAKGPVQVTVYASTDATQDGSDRVIGGPVSVNVALKPSGAKGVKVPVTLPADLTPGSYFLIAVIDDPAFPESDVADNTLVTGAPASVAP